MATLRETIQAKIASAKTDVTQWEADLVALEATAQGWLEKEVAEVEDFFNLLGKHL